MKVVTTFHPPSAVVCSVKCRLFAGSDWEHLVVGKSNRIDVYSCRPESLHHECGLEIWGRVLTVKAIPAEDSKHSNLVVMLDHPTPELLFLTYIASTESDDVCFTTTKYLPLYERGLRIAEYFNDIILDASGRLAVVGCYSGKLKFISLQDGRYGDDFDVGIPELSLLGLAFISASDGLATLAILHLDHHLRIQLLSRDVSLEEGELSPSLSTLLPSTLLPADFHPVLASPPILIHVPMSTEDPDLPGGVLLVGARELHFFTFASVRSQEKQAGKRRRLETRKMSGNREEALKANEKESERESRMREAAASVKWAWSEVTTWCIVDTSPNKYLLGDAFGRLVMLILDMSCRYPLVLLPLGETSPAMTISYLTSQIVYLGSHMGDSQLLRIEPIPTGALNSRTLPVPVDVQVFSASQVLSQAEKEDDFSDNSRRIGRIVDNHGNYVTVLQTFKNIGPIVDAILVDPEGTGEPCVVACSGGQNTGSINAVRRGADFEELVVATGLHDVTNVWPIRNSFMDKSDSHLLVSTLRHTVILRIGPDESVCQVESISKGFVTELPTLALCNIPRRNRNQGVSSYSDSPLVVQITPKALLLLEFDMSVGEHTQTGEIWTPDKLQGTSSMGTAREIVAAGVNPSQFVLGLSGRSLVLMNLTESDKFQIMSHRNLTEGILDNREISAISCAPLDPSKLFSVFIAVSFWGSNTVEIFSIERTELRSLCKTPAHPSLPRCVLLHQFSPASSSDPADAAHLLVGLGDGNVVTYPFKNMSLGDGKYVSLGEGPVGIAACQVDGKSAVFAFGSRSTVCFWDRRRMNYSPVMLRGVNAASRLNTQSFSDCLVVANHSGLLIGKIKESNKMHIRSVPFGLDNPRRIVYDPSREVFGVAFTRTEPTRAGLPELLKSSFKLLDATSFDVLSQFTCEAAEEISAIEIISSPSTEAASLFFCVGTYLYIPEEIEPSSGRLLVLGTLESQVLHSRIMELSLVAWTEVEGCVYSLTTMKGFLAAAVNASVILFSFDKSDDESASGYTLHKISEWTHNYIVRSLSAHDDKLFLGDVITSVSAVELVDTQLNLVARDYGPLWPMTIQALDDTSIIGSNADMNIFTYSVQPSDRQTVFKCDGSYHFADMITKFLPGSLTPQGSSNHIPLEPKQLFFTSSGHIGVIVQMDEQLSLKMTGLQRNMANADQGAGGTSHTRFRAPKSRKEFNDIESSYGFLDGDFMERFLTYSSTMLEKIMKGQNDAERLTMTVPEIREVLETLQSLH